MGHADEKVAIVDEGNKVVGYKLYSELSKNDTWRIISVWIENGKGQVLMQQRSFAKKLGPGLWTPAVEGTVDGDDSYLETAKRETQEEIGLTRHELRPTKLLRYKAEHGFRIVQGYLIKCDWPIEKFTPQEEELADLLWLDKQEVIDEIKSGDPKYPVSAGVWLTLFNLV